MTQTVYVAAYPRSGSTWFTRLLADVLNSPSGGCMPVEDATDPAAEGQDRPGPYMVRRGHYILMDDETGATVPQAHHLAWKRLSNERVIFLVRDPRDICISGAYHWQVEIEDFLEQMIAGDVAGLGRWDRYCEKWLYRTHWRSRQFVHAKYTDLLYDGVFELKSILKWLGLKGQDVAGAMERHSLAVYRNRWPKSEWRRQNIRQGFAGDWRNHFTPAMNERIWFEFGWMMKRLGYREQMGRLPRGAERAY